MILARFEESIRFCEEALANARAVGDRATEAHATDTMGVNVAYLGEPSAGLDLLESARGIADEVDDFEEIARTYANMADVLLTAGRYEEAADLGRSSYAFCVRHGLSAMYGAGLLNYAGWALHLLGRSTEALAALEEARSQPLDPNSEIMNLAVTASVEATRGEFEASSAHLAIARPMIANAIDTQLILPFTEARALTALGRGDPEEALAAVEDGIARSEPLIGGNIKRFGPVYALGLQAAADIVSTDRESLAARDAFACAERLMNAVEDVYRQIGEHHDAHLKLAEPYVALCRAEWSRVRHSPDPGAWAEAAERMFAVQASYSGAYARLREAEAELAVGGRSQQVELNLNEAYGRAVEMGAEPLRAAVLNLARRARIPLDRGSRSEDDGDDARFGLTAREIDVLRLLAAGRTNRQIGTELYISEKTVSIHVSNVLAKLGASRRAEVAALAARIGIAPAERAAHRSIL
jgi:DNA-binding CsgD family transcriptional regulator